MTTLGRLALAASALPFVAVVCACRSPTQVSLEVSTDVPCDRFKGLTITVGHLGEVEDKGAVVVSDLTLCHAGVSRLGSLVVTPSGAKDEEVTIKVVVGVDTTAIECKKPDYKGCIVARRALRFVPHEPLELPVSMAFSCVDHPCEPDTTCVKDVGCVPATIPDSTRCKGDGCDDASLAQGRPADAGPDVVADAVVDAPVDAPVDAATDADALTDGDADAGPTTGNATGVAVGNSYTCAILTGGALKCWGLNAYGEVGDGTTIDRSSPTPTKGVPAVRQVALGEQVSCAALVDGTVRCWGLNEEGNCGVAPSLGATPPTDPGLTGVAEVAIGYRHACARLTDGHMTCWGAAAGGNLGNGDVSGTPTLPTTLPLTGVQQITSTCARLAAGTVECWGDDMVAITAVPGLTKKAIDISDASDGNVLIVLEGGDVVHARRDGSGWTVPAEPIGATVGPAKRAVGYGDHTFVLLADGAVYSYDSYGDSAPKPVAGLGPGTVADLEAAASYDYPRGSQCAYMLSGVVRCWGSDLFGAVGIGRPELYTTPQRITSLTDVKRVRRFEGAFSAATAAVHGDGSISAWGSSLALGIDFASTPTKLALLGTTNSDIVMGEEMKHAYVVKSTTPPSLADFRFGALDTTKGLTNTAFTDYASVLLGYDWELGVRSGGQLEFWALTNNANVDGIFGEGDTVTKSKDAVVERTLPGTLAGVVGVSDAFGPFNATICGWLADGSVYCWGDNQDGVGGSPIENDVITSPLLIPFAAPKPKIVTMSMAKRHACGVDDTHRLWCWGANDLGQLGASSPPNTNIPVQVPGITNAVGVTCFDSSTCAWLTDKTASCWGSNRYGELGDGTRTDRSSPKAVTGLADVVSMDSSCAVHGSGDVSCWGDSYTGEVGTGVNGDVKTPTAVPGL